MLIFVSMEARPFAFKIFTSVNYQYDIHAHLIQYKLCEKAHVTRLNFFSGDCIYNVRILGQTAERTIIQTNNHGVDQKLDMLEFCLPKVAIS